MSKKAKVEHKPVYLIKFIEGHGSAPYMSAFTYEFPKNGELGKWYSIPKPTKRTRGRFIRCCYNGFHASPINRIETWYREYQSSTLRCFIVEVRGQIDFNHDKVAAEHMRIIKEIDIDQFSHTDSLIGHINGVAKYFDIFDSRLVLETNPTYFTPINKNTFRTSLER